MRKFFLLALAIFSHPLHAATLTYGAASGNWSDASKWVGSATPTASDDVLITVASGAAVTIDTTTCVAKSLTCTGYTGNLRFNASQILTVSGSVLFDNTHTLTGTGTLLVNATGTLTSAGLTFPGNLTTGATATYTLADAWTVTGSLTAQTGSPTFSGNSITVGGSLVITGVNFAGTSTITLNGSGAVSCSQQGALNNRYLAGAFTINTAGTVTFGQYFNFQGVCNFTAGTVDMTTNSNQFSTFGNSSFAGNGVTFSTLEIGNAGSAASVSFAATKTYVVTTKLAVVSPQDGYSMTLKSATASSSALLNYTGPLSGMQVFGTTFTDIDASGSTNPIWNYFGGTLTRTSNIFNVTLPSNLGAVYQ